MYIEIMTYDRPHIRTGDHKLEQVKGSHFSIGVEKGEGCVCLNVYDHPGQDNALCSIELSADMLKMALAILEHESMGANEPHL